MKQLAFYFDSRNFTDPSQMDFRMVENAGHFSFMSPFPESMNHPDFLPSTDPEGFDRVSFHQNLKREITAFLNSAL